MKVGDSGGLRIARKRKAEEDKEMKRERERGGRHRRCALYRHGISPNICSMYPIMISKQVSRSHTSKQS